MKASDILNNMDPNELRNILKRLKLNQSAYQRPVPNVVISQAPQQFPPSTTTVINNDLGWFNVKAYGAIGDGTTNDTAAINTTIDALTAAGRGVLYFPPGSYQSTGGHSITVPCLVMGMGRAKDDPATFVSKILCSSATASLFSVTALLCIFKDLSLVNNAGSTPSAGAGITVSSADLTQRVDYTEISVYGFYNNIDHQTGTNWVMNKCVVSAPVKYGLKIQNTASTGSGNWMIVDSRFVAGLRNSDAAIRIESGGGGRVANCEINGSGIYSFNHGIDITSGVSTGDFSVYGGLIQNVRGHGISVSASWRNIVIVGIVFGISWVTSNNTGNAVNVTGATGVVVSNCAFAGGASPAAISLTSVANARVFGNVNYNMGSLITQSSCTNVVIGEPGTDVIEEQSYGQSSDIGDSSYFAREDHTHGTPDLSTNAPQNVGSSAAAGSGTEPSKDDHVHKGVASIKKSGATSLFGNVTLSPGENVTLTQVGNDIEISVTGVGGQYRQYVYAVVGGEPSWVTDVDGNIVTVLQDLEAGGGGGGGGTGTDPNHAYYQNLAALLEPDAIEAFRTGTFTYNVSSSDTKFLLGMWNGRIGASGRFEIRDPRNPLPINDVTLTGLASTSYLVVIDPTLPSYTDARDTYFDRLQAIGALKTHFAPVVAASTITRFLPGPYGVIVTSVTCFDFAWLGLYLPNGGAFNLADEIDDSNTQRVAHSLTLPVSKKFANGLYAGAGGSGSGGITYVILPADWSGIVDSTTYDFRDDFMGATLNTVTDWTRAQSTAGNVEIDTNYQWLKLVGNTNWGTNGAFSQASIARANGKVFEVDIQPGLSTSGIGVIVGFHDGSGQSYSDFAHGVHFGTSGNINVYEAGTDRGVVGTWEAGMIYRVRITLGASNNATYEIQGGAFDPIGGATWGSIQPATSSNSTTPLYAGASIYQGTAYVSDTKIY